MPEAASKASKPKLKASRESRQNQQVAKISKIESLFTRLPFLKDRRLLPKHYLILAVVAIALLVVFKRSWFIAATVNGSPISNIELLSKMNQRYRSQVLNEMVDERIILAEANKQKVQVPKEDIDKQIKDIESRVGGTEVLNNLLTQQGQTREGLADQIKLQLTVEKLYEKEATISAQEVDEFIAKNKDSLEATDSAKQIEEATQTIKRQKLVKIISEKFQQLKQQSKTVIF